MNAEYGFERLKSLASRHAAAGAEKMAEALHQDLDAFAQGVPFGDDRTFVILRRL